MDPFANYFGTGMLEKALDAATLRQQVISNNIANVNTEGFRPQAVAFEEKLTELCQQASDDNPDSGGWPSGFQLASLDAEVETKEGKIDINREMTNLGKNQILYNALSSKISGYLGALKYVIDNSGR
ncbi:MAG: flagellar basal body rod protein FlgB [Armatimonadetes bacterium]|nr:flagellar basal body rod protein FlgB [Armatimonadota bacterium]